MPTAYIQTQAKKHNISLAQSENDWSRAKKQAKKQGHETDFGYVTNIYKKIVGESAKELSFKQFVSLVEYDDVADISYGDHDLEDEDIDDEDDLSSLDDVDLEGLDDEFDDESELDSDEELDSEIENGDDDLGDIEQGHQLAGIIGSDELDGETEEDDEDELRYETATLSFLGSLIQLNEKAAKKKPLKKAAKSVYHRDYVRTKNKPYRKYDPSERGE